MSNYNHLHNKKVVKEAEVVSSPEVQVNFVNVSQCTIDTDAIASQIAAVVEAMEATSQEQLDKIKKINLEIPVAIITGSPSIRSVDLK